MGSHEKSWMMTQRGNLILAGRSLDNEDSGTESLSPDTNDNNIFIRIHIEDLKLEKCMKFRPDDTVWFAKDRILTSLPKEMRDGINYGLYLPPVNGRAGKFLDEERPLRDYPLPGAIGMLEFKYKRRVYKLMSINPKKLKQMHSKSMLKQFISHVKAKEIDKIIRLTNKGLDPNYHDPDSGETPLTLAATLDKPRNLIMTLVSGGCLLDFRARSGMTAMHKASHKGNYEAVQTLLDLGASPNYKDRRGLTPLYYAVLGSTNAHCVEILLHDHAVLDVADERGWTEIHQACKAGRVQHLTNLLFYGAEMNCKNSSGNTALHVCAVNNQEECARQLLFRGADKTILNYANQDAFQVAVISGNTELAEVIRDFRPEDVVLFQEIPKYNEKRRSTLPTSLNSLQRSRSDPRLHALMEDEKSPSTSPSCNSPCYSSTASLYDDTANNPRYPQPYDSDSAGSMSISSTGSGSYVSDSVPITRRGSMCEFPVYSYGRRRLYPALPGRIFICVKPHKAQNEAELDLKKGQFVEVLSVGEQGYWEGKVGQREGWFPSYSVEEVQLRKDKKGQRYLAETDRVLVQRKTLIELAKSEGENAPRTVVLTKGKSGFGFILRGAKSQRDHRSTLEFSPTPEFPALQYLDRVDKGSVADKAGLKPGDFLLEINHQSVGNATHEHTVRLIKNSGHTLAMKVVTVKPLDSLGCEHMDGTRTLPHRTRVAPTPPQRHPKTSLSPKGGQQVGSFVHAINTLDETIANYDNESEVDYQIQAETEKLDEMAMQHGIDVTSNTASISRRTKRMTAIFDKTQEPRGSVGGRNPIPVATPIIDGFEKGPMNRAKSTPNLANDDTRYSQHVVNVGVGHQLRKTSNPPIHGEYAAGGQTVTNVNISTVAGRDQVVYHNEPKEVIYDKPFAGPRTSDQGTTSNLNIVVPPPPKQAAPKPPDHKTSSEVVKISTRQPHIYENVQASIEKKRPFSSFQYAEDEIPLPKTISEKPYEPEPDYDTSPTEEENRPPFVERQTFAAPVNVAADKRVGPVTVLPSRQQLKPVQQQSNNRVIENTSNDMTEFTNSIKEAALQREARATEDEKRKSSIRHEPPPQTPPPPPPPPPPTMTQTVVPPPPKSAPPPPPPLKPVSDSPSGTVSRALPPSVQKQLQGNRQQEESHAALMAAINKRRNMLDQNNKDMGQDIEQKISRSKNLQSTLFKSDQSKVEISPGKTSYHYGGKKPEVKSETTTPVKATVHGNRQLAAAATTTTLTTDSKTTKVEPAKKQEKKDDSMNYLAMAEKARQDFLLKRSASNAGNLSSDTKEEKDGEDKNKEVTETNITPSKAINDHPKFQTSPNEKPSANGDGPMGNLASLIAQKANSRQKDYVDMVDSNGNKKTQSPGQRIVYGGVAGTNKANNASPGQSEKKINLSSQRNGEVCPKTTDDNGEKTPISVSAKAKMFQSAIHKNEGNGYFDKSSKTVLKDYSNGRNHSIDTYILPPPPLIPSSAIGDIPAAIPPPADFNIGNNGLATDYYPRRSSIEQAALARKLGQISQYRQGSVERDIHSNGVAQMVLIDDPPAQLVDPYPDGMVVPPPPLFTEETAQSFVPIFSQSMPQEDVASVVSSVSTLSTLSSADHDSCSHDSPLHSSGPGTVPYSIAIAEEDITAVSPPPPLDFSDLDINEQDQDFVPPPVGFGSESFRDKPIETWSTDDVCNWLDSLQLGEYRGLFTVSGINGLRLIHMGRNDLMSLGVQVVHRMTIEQAIKEARVGR